MLGIGNAIGIPFQKGSTVPWTPLVPLGGESPNFWYQEGTRSGLTLPDAMGGVAATILPAYHYNNSSANYLSVADNGALDIRATDFTLCGWFNSESTSKLAYRGLAGKLVYGATQGRYGLYVDITTGYITAMVQSSGGGVTINTTTVFGTAGVVFLRMWVDQANHKVHLAINEVEQGTGTAFTGTFPAMANGYQFRIGIWNNAGGTGVEVATSGYASSSDIYVFNKLLSPGEITALYTNRAVVTGAKAHWPLLGGVMYEYDCSGNNYDLTGTVTAHTLTRYKYSYGTMGSRHGLDVGYTCYRNDYVHVYVPYLDAGTERLTPPMQTTDFIKKWNKPGDATNHNLANSMIVPPGATWDKSDVTLVGGESRLTFENYIAATPKAWHIEELNSRVMYNTFLTNKEGLNFVKCGTDTRDNRDGNLELFSYTTNKTGADLTKILTYTGDIAFQGGVDYNFQTLHICTQRDNKVLTFDDVRYLKLSLDGGATIYSTLDLNGVTGIITFAHIWANGNITFASYTKIYYSTDNLATYSEATTLNIAGGAYVPSTYDNFATLLNESNAMVGAVEHLVWTNYSISAGTEYANINIWESVDDGLTVRSVYKCGTTIPVLAYRHGHGTAYDSVNNKWYAFFGDGTNECNVLEGTRNAGTGAWTWSKKAGDNEPTSGAVVNDSWYKILGMFFYNGFIYFCMDCSRDNRYGVYKVKIADYTDKTKYVKILNDSTAQCSSLYGNKTTGEMLCSRGNNTTQAIMYTKDGVVWMHKNIVGGPTLNAVGAYYETKPANTAGYYRFDIFANTEAGYTFHGGTVLMVKLK